MAEPKVVAIFTIINAEQTAPNPIWLAVTDPNL
jgi:hypothetical protein